MLNDPTKLTKAERKRWKLSVDVLRQIEYDLHDRLQQNPLVPETWHSIWESEGETPPGKVAVTMRLDADIVKFFRALGPGYTTRMNAVLRAFMHLRLSKMVDGVEASDYVERPGDVESQGRGRP